jgi:hypothetical protein
MSHFALIKKGFDYLFGNGPDFRSQDVAKRAVFQQYQTYPDNMVQGSGVLVAQGMVPGNYFMETQPAQVWQNFTPIDASLVAGGTIHGVVALQPLIDTSSN